MSTPFAILVVSLLALSSFASGVVAVHIHDRYDLGLALAYVIVAVVMLSLIPVVLFT